MGIHLKGRALSFLLAGAMIFQSVPATAYGQEVVYEEDFFADEVNETIEDELFEAAPLPADEVIAEVSDQPAKDAEAEFADPADVADLIEEEPASYGEGSNSIAFAPGEVHVGDETVTLILGTGITSGFAQIYMLDADAAFQTDSVSDYVKCATVPYSQLSSAGEISVTLDKVTLVAGKQLVALLRDGTSGPLVDYVSAPVTIAEKSQTQPVQKTPLQAFEDSAVTLSTGTENTSFLESSATAHVTWHLDPTFESAALFVYTHPGGAAFDGDSTENKRLFVKFIDETDGEADVTFSESALPLKKGWNVTASLYICLDGEDWYRHQPSKPIQVVDENGEGTPVYTYPHISLVEDQLMEGATTVHATLTGDERLFANDKISITYVVTQYPENEAFDLDEPYMDPLVHVDGVKAGFENLELKLKSPVKAGYRVRAIVYWSQDVESFVPKGNDYEAAGIPDNSIPVIAAPKEASIAFGAASVDAGAEGVDVIVEGNVPEGALAIAQMYPKNETYQFGTNGTPVGVCQNLTEGTFHISFTDPKKITSDYRLAAVILSAGKVIAQADTIPINAVGTVDPVTEPTIRILNNTFTTQSRSVDLQIAGAEDYLGGYLYVKTAASKSAIEGDGGTTLYTEKITQEGTKTVSFSASAPALKAGDVVVAYLYIYDFDHDATHYLYSEPVLIESTGEEAFTPSISIVTSEIRESATSLWVKANFDSNAVKGTLLLYNYTTPELNPDDFDQFTILGSSSDVKPSEDSQRITFISGRTPAANSKVKALLRTTNLVTKVQQEYWSDMVLVQAEEAEEPLSAPQISIKDKAFTPHDMRANLAYSFDSKVEDAKVSLLYYSPGADPADAQVLSGESKVTRSSAQDAAVFNYSLRPLTVGYQIQAKLEVTYKGNTTTVLSEPVAVEEAPNWAEPVITILAEELNTDTREITVNADYDEGYQSMYAFFSNITLYQYPDYVDDTEDEFWEGRYESFVQRIASVQNARGVVTLQLFESVTLQPGYKVMAKLRLPNPEWWDEFDQDADEDYVSAPVEVYGNREALLYHFQEGTENAAGLREIFANRGVTVKDVTEADLGETIGALLQLEGYEKTGETYEGTAPDTQFLLMANFSDAFLDTILADMKDAGVYIPHKAILTETNKDYTLAQLIGDIEEEHELMTAQEALSKAIAQAKELLGEEGISEENQKALEALIREATALLEEDTEDLDAVTQMTGRVTDTVTAQKEAAEKAAAEKAAAEKAAAEKAAAEKAAAEKAAAEKAAAEEKAAAGPEKGTKLTKGKFIYRVIKPAKKAVNGKAAVKGSVRVSGFAKAADRKKATSITVPASIKVDGRTYLVTEIAKNAFAKASKVKKAVIGANVQTIGANAFKNAAKLKKITIKSKKLTAKKVGKNAFKGTAKKIAVKVPKAKLKAYKKFLIKKGISKKGKIK